MAQVCNHFMGTGTPAKPKVLSDEELHNSGLDSVRIFFLFFLGGDYTFEKKYYVTFPMPLLVFQPGHTNGLLRFRAKSPNAERRTTPKYVTSCYGREVCCYVI
jgi:hypothetical protein